MTIYSDQISNQTLSLDSNGYRADRTFLIDSVSGAPESRLYNAMTGAGIPQLNDPHPILPDVRVTNIRATPENDNSVVRVVVTYSIPKPEDIISDGQQNVIDDSTVSLNTGLSSESTWFDIEGNFLTAVWRGSTRQTAYKEASVQRPQLSINFRRIESEIPRSAILNYLGRVNSVSWSGFPPKTWLCTKIDASEDQNGRFNIDYGFSYKEETWRLEVVLNLSQAQIDELPPDTETANGYQVYDVYRTADFNALGFSF